MAMNPNDPSFQGRGQSGPGYQGQGQQYGSGIGHGWSERPGRVIDSRTVEVTDASQAQQFAAQVATVPGVKFSTSQDPNTGRIKVTLSIKPEAASRMQQVTQLHQQLTQLAARTASLQG